VLIAGLLLALSSVTYAQPCSEPSNEECDGAIVFSSDDLPYATAWVLGCGNDVPDAPYRDVFFQFDCTVAGDHTFDMCESAGDTFIRIYTDGCGFGDGRELATGDDECPGSPPSADPMITVALDVATYWIELGTWRPDPPWAPVEPNAPIVLNVRREPPACAADLDGAGGAPDGSVGFADVTLLLSSWGPCGACPPSCPGDLNGDCSVGFGDLTMLLNAWGPCP
jgi:hypothetical protein